MGAQKKSGRQVVAVEDIGIVVDINRVGEGAGNSRPSQNTKMSPETDMDDPSPRISSSGMAGNSKDDVVDAVAPEVVVSSRHHRDNDRDEGPIEGEDDNVHPKTDSLDLTTNGNTPINNDFAGATAVVSKLREELVFPSQLSVGQQPLQHLASVDSPVSRLLTDSKGGGMSHGLPSAQLQPAERERMSVMSSTKHHGTGSRKRKKTVHYMNSRVPHSRVPHALPAVDSDDCSDGLDSPEDADDVPVRTTPGPRAAVTKLKSMVPVGDKLMKAPRNAKELMATRLLEGHFVRCQCRGIQLTGMLRDMGVQCDCRNCRGSVIVSISAFEAHSGSTSHHPSDNIYLENGKNLRDILSAGQEAADCGDNILRALRMAIGDIQGVEKRTIACAKCGSSEEGDLIPCNGPRCPLVFHSGCTGVAHPQLGDWYCPKCEKGTKPRGVVKSRRPLCGGMEREDTRVRERDSAALARIARDEHLYKALFLPGGLEDGAELGYYSNLQIKLKGVKRGEGVCCDCCNKEMSCAAFEQHAGYEARRNPYGSILLVADGRSLKEVCKGLAHQNKLGEKSKHIARKGEVNCCFGCGNSGELRCYDCDQTWCGDCVEEVQYQGGEMGSEGKWHCRFCQLDTFKVVKIEQKVPGHPMEGLIEKDERDRFIRHILAPVSVGGCAICKKWNLSKSGLVEGITMLVCDQCGREYHVSCLKGEGEDDLKELPDGEWFCQKDCKVIDEILTQLVANGPESLSDSIISELLESRQQQGDCKGRTESISPSFGWQILCGRGGDNGNVQTLGEAVNIFTECSDPIRDAKTGRNLIPLMVHSRRSKEYDFEGIFCVVLTRNGKVVSAALLQIFGREIAEVPLVATSLPHQGQGFCKALMTTIERLLGVLSVGRLVLPTSKDTESIWINKFGFGRMEEEKLSEICTTIRLMTFTGTCMLGKEIIPMTV